ncbi:MAG TPA: YeaH/YhbH family protein [Gammaproteobacteria bacterium]|nr:YeaH/YhbH family protein [Gammaproteobacteria bacterium]
MSRFIDRRPNGRHKSAVNRQRFMRRYKRQIQEAVRHAITGRSIKEVDESGEKIYIPAKDINEPQFRYGDGGERHLILPGNKEFVPGDLLKRPPRNSGNGRGGKASNGAEGMDDFVFEISKEEFLELFFEDLALPNLIKTQIAKIPAFKMIRAGFTHEGNPSNINIVRSLKGAVARKVALSAPSKEKLEQLELELANLLAIHPESPKVTELKEEIELLKKRLHAIPFIDPFDLRYNNRVRQPKPTTQAVMFCLMDVSGSMDEAKKDIAKRFFILLYLFLSRNYENVEVVFIRHHTSAKEVDEEEFFYSRETGGTVVSSALELMKKIMMSRYPTTDWNIYAAQASDGDNWNNDSPRCRDLLLYDILPHVQYFAYVEIMPRHHQSLWEAYLTVKESSPQFAMQHIEEIKDIYPVFRELFKRQESITS